MRSDLSNIPSSPFMVYIEPTDLCTIKCKFCFFQDYDKKRSIMSSQIFFKIITGLSSMGGVKVINLYHGGEPLLHKSIVRIVVLSKMVADKVIIKTNGTLLNADIADKLAGAGLDILFVSVLATNDEDYYRLSGKKIKYETILDNVKQAHKSVKGRTMIHCKIADYGLSVEQKKKFMSDFSGITDKCEIEHLISSPDGKGDYTLGMNDGVGHNGEKAVDRDVCPYPFYSLVFRADGTVGICCVDYDNSINVGDVNDSAVKDIWQGEELRYFRIIQLEGLRGNNKNCRNCSMIKYHKDNIDNIRYELLSKI